MRSLWPVKALSVAALILTMPWLSACNLTSQPSLSTGSLPSRKAVTVTDAGRDCIGRAMYFEAKRSEADGLREAQGRCRWSSSAGSINLLVEVVRRSRHF